MNNYYVYILLDPTYNDGYVINHGIYFKCLPFYVGITKNPNKRLQGHINGDRNLGSFKTLWIDNILKVNKKPIMEIYAQDLSKHEALNCEKKLIEAFGRYDQGTGVLLNKNSGGAGGNDKIVADYTKERMSQAQILRNSRISKEEKKAIAAKAMKTKRKNGTHRKGFDIAYNITQNANKDEFIKLFDNIRYKCVDYSIEKYDFRARIWCKIHGISLRERYSVKLSVKNGRTPCGKCNSQGARL